jgi:4-amino-4-deoxy-L-arabinose transferase-like glycosyltransferase
MTSPRSRWPGGKAALLLGGALLAGYLLFVLVGVGLLQHNELFHLPKHPDLYGDVAANIAEGNGYRLRAEGCETMFREPGYILTVAAVYSIFGESPEAARAVNVLLLGAAAWLTFLLAVRVGVPKPGARLAGLLVLVFPSVVFSMLRVSPEILFSTLILATLLRMTTALQRPTTGNFALAGLLLALTALTRTIVLPFAPVFALLALYALRRSPGLRAALARCAAFCLVFGLVFGLWPLRNYLLSQHMVVTATVSGDALFQGMYTSKLAGSGLPYHHILQEATREQRRVLEREDIPYWGDFYQFHEKLEDELRHSAAFKAEVLKEYRQDPMLFVNSVCRHVWAFWFKGRTSRSSLLVAAYMAPLLLAAGLGLRRVYRSPAIRPTLLFMLTTYLLHLPILAHSRHSVYMVPLLAVLAACNLAPGQQGRESRA